MIMTIYYIRNIYIKENWANIFLPEKMGIGFKMLESWSFTPWVINVTRSHYSLCRLDFGLCICKKPLWYPSQSLAPHYDGSYHGF